VRMSTDFCSIRYMNAAAPPARGRPRGFDREEAVGRAIPVFWRHGYAGASLAALTAAMDINPPSLYAAFGDKRGLFLTALDRYGETTGARPLAALASSADRRRALQAMLRAAVELSYDGAHGRGCLAACVAVQAAGDDDAIRHHVAALFRRYETALAEALGTERPNGGLLLGAIHALAVRARAGASRRASTALADDLFDVLAARLRL
jgi:TetR/AcrR family transcriptional regulator, copper-responsive repressor